MTRAHTPRSPRAAARATLRSVPEPAAGTHAEPPDKTTRHDGWDLERQTAFLRALSATHSVSEAAKSVGRSRQSAYALRSQLKGQAFDLAWEVAFHHSYDVLAHTALERGEAVATGALRPEDPGEFDGLTGANKAPFPCPSALTDDELMQQLQENGWVKQS